jgi:hypothetical protein
LRKAKQKTRLEGGFFNVVILRLALDIAECGFKPADLVCNRISALSRYGPIETAVKPYNALIERFRAC